VACEESDFVAHGADGIKGQCQVAGDAPQRFAADELCDGDVPHGGAVIRGGGLGRHSLGTAGIQKAGACRFIAGPSRLRSAEASQDSGNPASDRALMDAEHLGELEEGDAAAERGINQRSLGGGEEGGASEKDREGVASVAGGPERGSCTDRRPGMEHESSIAGVELSRLIPEIVSCHPYLRSLGYLPIFLLP